ncbi:hypothetical protein [Pontibacter sp. G13]|uniref:hypothetical protein n=1 Tax=Pontibacter sp. G13 TaxID=3074898 RepID=UPI002889FB87|nr:hypothetical protein [Pontibacter sp. G13]WNJ21436.1 hypothetical protein RJD25_13285 [Pontibacter sp. G13]
MKLLFLSEVNLRDQLFVKDLVHNFKFEDKVLLLHDTFGGTVRDTRFVTKRLSSLLSECMVYNNAFSADQRDFCKMTPDGLKFHAERIDQQLTHIQMLILGPVIAGENAPQLADPFAMVHAARVQFAPDEVIVFTDNPMSPLAQKKEIIQSQSDVDRLLPAFEEEKHSLELALEFCPATLASPVNYAM